MRTIFTYGSLLDASALFQRILQRPEVRELGTIGGHGNQRQKYWDTLRSIVNNIQEYLTVVLRTKGSRTKMNEQTYRTILAACSGINLKRESKVYLASELLGVRCNNMSRAIKDRAKIKESPDSGYVECTRKTYRNKNPDQVCHTRC